MTFRDALIEGSTRLQSGDILFCDTPFLDSSVLLAFAAGLSKEQLFSRYPEELHSEIYENFINLIEKRLKGLPVSYIRKQKEFYGRDFYVDQRVLVPRPDTECIIDQALTLLSGQKHPDLLDLCTGSGCIAVTLKLENPLIRVTASDVSSDAIDVAESNAEYLSAEVKFIESSLFDSISGKFDMIVTNPPYLSSRETNGMKLSGWPEPELALDGGDDGLDLIRKIVLVSLNHLKNNSYLLIEAGPQQAETISSLMTATGFLDVKISKDLAGRNRITSGRTSGS
ncbi:MAG: peptide chain release factor N(5)-glutamine methyltransferase [Spirochaetales bacterium]|nr:peptide chain release factor N(5)-glutamine methyltransferase [Spirochaetales bacterium]